MKRLVSIIPLIIVVLIANLNLTPQQPLYTDNIQILFLDVVNHNNIVALAFIEEEAERDSSVYQRIGLTESEFGTLKAQVCQNHLTQVRNALSTDEDDAYYFNMICGKYVSI